MTLLSIDWGLEPPECEVNEQEYLDLQVEQERQEEEYYDAADVLFELEGDR